MIIGCCVEADDLLTQNWNFPVHLALDLAILAAVIFLIHTSSTRLV
jgi:hypothetical protein